MERFLRFAAEHGVPGDVAGDDSEVMYSYLGSRDVAVLVYTRFPADGRVLVNLMFTAPEFRRKKVMSFMLRNLEKMSRGCTIVFAATTPAAVALGKRRGYMISPFLGDGVTPVLEKHA